MAPDSYKEAHEEYLRAMYLLFVSDTVTYNLINRAVSNLLIEAFNFGVERGREQST